MVWPSIRVRTDIKLNVNGRLQQIGDPRRGIETLFEDTSNSPSPEPNLVSVSALTKPEAGPREMVGSFSQVAIVVSGGIAPGINAVIDGIVQRHWQYDTKCVIHGFTNGFFGLKHGTRIRLFPKQENLKPNERCIATSEFVSRGGSMIGTYRLQRLDEEGPRQLHGRRVNQQTLEAIFQNLNDYSALYVIGGDGSMKMANMLLAELRKREKLITVVGIPKTMDNDILWVWQSFGFATAVKKARDIIDCLSVEKCSNPRICIVQLFGSVSGFVVSHAVLACQPGECDAALIPEAAFSISGVAECIRRRMKALDLHIPDGLIVMAETAIPRDWKKFARIAELTATERRKVHEFERVKPPDYLEGQTSDELRSAGLKLLRRGLEAELKKTLGEVVRVFTNEPRHILRSSNPSFSDIIFGQRLGALAVDNALAGYGDFMVSQWLTEFVLVPLRLVSIGRKRIHQDGIFWKSVLAKTGQGDLHTSPTA
jgi:6-phosphofructokinase 1